jgi:hypothetical protein
MWYMLADGLEFTPSGMMPMLKSMGTRVAATKNSRQGKKLFKLSMMGTTMK